MSSSFLRKQRRRFNKAMQKGVESIGEAARWGYLERLLIYDAQTNALLPKEGWTLESIAQAWRAKCQIEELSRPRYEPRWDV